MGLATSIEHEEKDSNVVDKIDLLNAKIDDASYDQSEYDQWKIEKSNNDSLLCDIKTQLKAKLKKNTHADVTRDKYKLKLAIVDLLYSRGIVPMKSIHAIAIGYKEKRKNHYNSWIHDLIMNELPVLSFAIPEITNNCDDGQPIRYIVPKKTAFKQSDDAKYTSNMFHSLLDVMIEQTISHKQKNKYLQMLFADSISSLEFTGTDRYGVMVLKNLLEKIYSDGIIRQEIGKTPLTDYQRAKLYSVNELINAKADDKKITNQVLTEIRNELKGAETELNELME
eukprot:62937_1